ncbi:MAG: YitT family protein [Defluviitaleaceae bacterium]|nr:YitT family protein [Defluviitaleaceae bacterium]
MKKSVFIDYLFITLGCCMLSFAVILFFSPQNLVTGGISGLGIIIMDYTEAAGFRFPIPIWLTNLVLNIPLFVIGYRIMDRTYFVRSLYGYGVMTVAFYVWDFVRPMPGDMMLSALYGGVIAGIGIALVFRAKATTGGSTLIAAILQRWAFKHHSAAKILFVVDSCIILTGLLVFGPIAAMYAVIAVFVSSKVADTVLEGLSFAKAAFIISKENDIIADKILTEMNRGATEITSRGMFTKNNQPMLMCVVSAKELVELKQLVHSLDERAFVIVADVREVLGEGFTEAKI